uniref:Uncharacterized protein n=1 Tax=Glossina brevipalpis TaxID=37001 RepID=A0A1A9WJR6_9MUSC
MNFGIKLIETHTQSNEVVYNVGCAAITFRGNTLTSMLARVVWGIFRTLRTQIPQKQRQCVVDKSHRNQLDACVSALIDGITEEVIRNEWNPHNSALRCHMAVYEDVVLRQKKCLKYRLIFLLPRLPYLLSHWAGIAVQANTGCTVRVQIGLCCMNKCQASRLGKCFAVSRRRMEFNANVGNTIQLCVVM